ncbi:MAG: cysteine-rich CWC family protein [Pyrinomonadaceae bacterium]
MKWKIAVEGDAGLKLPKVMRELSLLRRPPSNCEACGEAFTCGATLTGCWCNEVKVSESVRENLRARFHNCLCRSCLERFANDEQVESINSMRKAN